MTIAAERNFKLPLQKSVDRIVTYPIVGDSYNFINIVYTKVKVISLNLLKVSISFSMLLFYL